MTTELRILDAIDRRTNRAPFVTEIAYGLRPPCDPADFTGALERLVERGEVLIVRKPAPDPHLADADLRIVARSAPDAAAAIEATWQQWLREFLASHRCS